MSFTVEISDVADAEIDKAYFRLSARNPEFASRWLDGVYRIIGTLDEFPLRHSRADESDVMGRETRRMIYRNGQTVYRILFTLLDADGDGADDTVRVLRVLYGAQRPLRQRDDEGDQ